MEDLKSKYNEILIGMPMYSHEFSSLVEVKKLGNNTYEYYDKIK